MRLLHYILILTITILTAACGVDTPLEESEASSSDKWVDGDVITIQQTDSGDGLDVIIMGDGFAESQMTKDGIYEQIMRQAAAHIVSIEPVKSYSQHLNIYAVVVVSEQSGISAESEDEATTALGCYYGDGTSIDGDHSTIQQYTYNISGFTYSDLCQAAICVVLNDNKHAGTTYFFNNALLTIAYCPYEGYDNTLFRQIVHHEVVGHGIGRLLDEYIYYDTEIDSETLEELEYSMSNGLGKNLSTDSTNPSWSYLFDIDGYDEVGVYEGGYFYTKGVYRPEYVSCMEDNRAYFNAPSRQAIVERIFEECDEEFSFDDFITNDIKTQPTTIPEPVISISSRSGETADMHLHPPITLEMPSDAALRGE